jgi:Fe-S-cluster containining protein
MNRAEPPEGTPMVRFRCLMEGDCCRKYWIPIIHTDLYRLHAYGRIEVRRLVECVDLYPCDDEDRRFKPLKFGGELVYLALRSNDDGCVFLSRDGKCSVHGFKPLVCRFYPFLYVVKEDGDVDIELNERAIEECKGLEVDDPQISLEIQVALKSLARARLREIELWNKTVDEVDRVKNDLRDKELLIKELLRRAETDRENLCEEGLWIV